MALSFAVPAVVYGVELFETEHYQFVWLLPAVVLWLAPARRPTECRPGSAAWTAAGLLPAILLWGMSLASGSLWLGAVAAWVAAVAAFYAWGGSTLVRAWIPVWALLSLAIRPPLDLDVDLVRYLQGLAAYLAGQILDLLGVVHIVSGSVLNVPGRRLLVEEACSGVQSLFAGWALAWIVVLAWRRGPVHWLVLMATVPVWAIAVNALRIVLVAVLWTKFGIEAHVGSIHTLIGLGIFGVTAWLIVSTDRWLARRSPTADEMPSYAKPRESNDAQVAPRNWPSFNQTPLASRLIAAGGLGMALATIAAFSFGGVLRSEARPIELPPLGAGALPEKVGPWRQVGHEILNRPNRLGEGTQSQVWRFEGPAGRALVALDYPFSGWHELSICYPADGWNLKSRTVYPGVVSESGLATVLTEACYEQPAVGLHGMLIFDLFDHRGRPVYSAGDPQDLTSRLMRRLGRWSAGDSTVRTLQLQVFVENDATLDVAATEDLRHLFSAARQALAPLCVRHLAEHGHE